ncbi:MAG TPA: radical SAM protein [Thermoanaerobaculia bacterium]|nr:radical SAM protein [Thermoanaerobaculia bacterium]
MTSQRSERILEYSAPISVFLNLTQQCNMRCVYCSAEAVRPCREGNGELSDGELIGLVDLLVEARVFNYILTGGEPLLRRDLLFRILERLPAWSSATLLTNGSLITDDDARRLAGFRNLSGVAVSIDAPTEESNAQTRGRGFLARTLRGAMRLIDQGITPAVNCVMSRTNQHLLPELVQLLKDRGFRRLYVIHVHPFGRGKEQESLSLGCRERLAVSRKIVELAAREQDFKIVLEDEPWIGLEAAACRLRGSDRGPARLLPCSAGVEQCTISADGWVAPCNAMSEYRCGNVREQDFLTIWRESPRLKAMRELRSTPVTAVSECSACELNRLCRGGCRALAFAASGDLLGFDPTCPFREDEKGRLRKPLPVIH